MVLGVKGKGLQGLVDTVKPANGSEQGETDRFNYDAKIQ